MRLLTALGLSGGTDGQGNPLAALPTRVLLEQQSWLTVETVDPDGPEARAGQAAAEEMFGGPA